MSAITQNQPSYNGIIHQQEVSNGSTSSQEQRVDEAVEKIFEILNKDANVLNDLVRENFQGREISFMDYIGCVESVYDKFIEKIKQPDLKDQSEYVVSEIFDNSGLGETVYSKLTV